MRNVCRERPGIHLHQYIALVISDIDIYVSSVYSWRTKIVSPDASPDHHLLFFLVNKGAREVDVPAVLLIKLDEFRICKIQAIR